MKHKYGERTVVRKDGSFGAEVVMPSVKEKKTKAMKPKQNKVIRGWTHKQYLKSNCDHMLIFLDRKPVHDFNVQVEIRPVAAKKRKVKR